MGHPLGTSSAMTANGCSRPSSCFASRFARPSLRRAGRLKHEWALAAALLTGHAHPALMFFAKALDFQLATLRHGLSLARLALSLRIVVLREPVLQGLEHGRPLGVALRDPTPGRGSLQPASSGHYATAPILKAAASRRTAPHK